MSLSRLSSGSSSHALPLADVRQSNLTRVVVDAANSTHPGRYQCVASNKEGPGRSNEVQLDVLCK